MRDPLLPFCRNSPSEGYKFGATVDGLFASIMHPSPCPDLGSARLLTRLGQRQLRGMTCRCRGYSERRLSAAYRTFRRVASSRLHSTLVQIHKACADQSIALDALRWMNWPLMRALEQQQMRRKTPEGKGWSVGSVMGPLILDNLKA